MTPMSKKEAEERLCVIEKEVAALRQIINTPEKAPSLLLCPPEGSPYYQIESDNYGKLCILEIGGNFSINSEIGKGTSVNVELLKF